MADTISNDAGKAAKPGATGAATAPSVDAVGTESATANTTGTSNVADARSRFGKAVEEARAGAEALRDEALERGAAYKERITSTTGSLTEDARAYADQAKEKAASIAREGKTRASDALAAVGRTIADTAGTVDEKLGPQYGNYARNAARWTQETAAKLESKEFSELGEDVKDFVRKSPGLAIGIAAVAGFALARMLSGGKDSAASESSQSDSSGSED